MGVEGTRLRIVMSKFKRKIRKLIKTPRLFFKDSKIFKLTDKNNTIDLHSNVDESKLLLNNHKVNLSSLAVDYITPHEQEGILFIESCWC